MTATTKEQRAAASLYIEKHTALQATFPAHFIIALLNDSERLAAIEEVTGEEVRELVRTIELRQEAQTRVYGEPVDDLIGLCSTALLSLSAKVAEQEEGIKRRERAFQSAMEGQRALASLLGAAETSRDAFLRLLTETAVPALEWLHKDLMIRAEVDGNEKIVPCGASAWVKLCDALSTIRAQMGGGE